MRFPVAEADRWAAPLDGWHIDGGRPALAARASVVVLPLLTAIRPGGGGTALLRGSHRAVARMLRGNARICPQEIALAELRARGSSAVVEATGRVRGPHHRIRPHHTHRTMGWWNDSRIYTYVQAGDLLLMHPHLVHAPSAAHRATLQGGVRVAHGLRVTFNLATRWARPPLRYCGEEAVEFESVRVGQDVACPT